MAGHFFYAITDFISAWAWHIALLVGVVMFFRIRAIEADKQPFVAGMFAWFFLIIMTFWLLKPLKKSLFVGYYKLHGGEFLGWSLEPAQMELLAKEANLLVALAYFLVLSWSRGSLPQGMYYPLLVSACYGVGLLAFALTAHLGNVEYVWLLYLFGDLLVISLVAVFFSFLHAHTDVAGSRRLYGLIGMGGVLGGFTGSATVSTFGRALDTEQTLIFACFFLVMSILVQVLISHRMASRPDATGPARGPEFVHPPQSGLTPREGPTRWSKLWSGANIVLRSRHLMLIAGMLALYEVVSVLMDYQFTEAVTRQLDPEQYKAYFSSVFTFSNALSVLVQLALTGWLLKRFGPHLALYVMPMAILVGSGLYFAAPILLFASLLSTADNAFAYSVQQTSREALYVPTSTQEKYEAKAFIDVVWLRASKGVAILLGLGVSLVVTSANSQWLSLTVMFMVVLWLALLGKMLVSYRQLTATRGQP